MAENDELNGTADPNTSPEDEAFNPDQPDESQPDTQPSFAERAQSELKSQATKKITQAATKGAERAVVAGGQRAALSALAAFGPEILAGILILIAILTSVLAIAFVICSYQGCNGKNAGDAKLEIAAPADVDILKLAKCLEQPRPELASNPDAKLPPDCIKLLFGESKEKPGQIAKAKTALQAMDVSVRAFPDSADKTILVEQLAKMNTELGGIEAAGGAYNKSATHAQAYEEARVKFQASFTKLLSNCEGVEAIFTKNAQGYYATPITSSVGLSRYRQATGNVNDVFVTRDMACYLIRLGQSSRANGVGSIELGDGSHFDGSAAPGHASHFGGKVIDIWVANIHPGDLQGGTYDGAKAAQLAKLIMNLGAKMLIVGSSQTDLAKYDLQTTPRVNPNGIQGVVSDQSGVHNNHWHIQY